MNSQRAEELLRAALTAHTDLITAEDLQPNTAPSTRKARRRIRAILAPAALTAAAAIAVGGWVFAGRQPHTGPGGPVANPSRPPISAPASAVASPTKTPPPLGAAPGGQVSIIPVVRTTTLPGSGATVTYPDFEVADGRVRATLTQQVDALVDTYREDERLRSLRITAAVFAYEGYVSVRLDTAADTAGPGAPPRIVAVVVDTTTGSAAGAGDLFTDVDSADRLMRAALPLKTATAAKLTMGAASGGVLAWYPAPDGLHWVVAPCAVADCAAGPVQAVVPWARLAAVTRS